MDGIVGFVHSLSTAVFLRYKCQLSLIVCPTKLLKSDIFRLKCLSHNKISAILRVLYFLFLHFLCHFPCLFDNCDVVYNWSKFLCCHRLYLIIYLEIQNRVFWKKSKEWRLRHNLNFIILISLQPTGVNP